MATTISFDSFLKKSLITFLEKSKTVCFKGEKEYPLLFFSMLFQKIKKENKINIKILDCTVLDNTSIIAQCSTNFLGLRTVYWLKNTHKLTAKKKTELLNFLKNYTGTNIIVFFLLNVEKSVVSNDFDRMVTIPDKINQKIMMQLSEKIVVSHYSISKKNIDLIIKKYKTFSLDTACLLLHYLLVLGSNADSFMKNYLGTLIEQDYSLFMISQYFFQKNAKQFFSYWKKIYKNYSLQFWIIFWSEQLWRAYNVIEYMSNKKFADAKRISFRLPFSFLQKDYKTIDTQILAVLHQQLYDFDYALKNGGSEIGLEIAFVNFFTH